MTFEKLGMDKFHENAIENLQAINGGKPSKTKHRCVTKTKEPTENGIRFDWEIGKATKDSDPEK